MIKRCTCKHAYQDEKYGQGKRVFNTLQKVGMYRCTVCKNEVGTTFK